MISSNTPPTHSGDAPTVAELQDTIARLRRQNNALSLRLARSLEEERKQLARELHDEISQSLTAIKSDAVLISNLSKGNCPQRHASAQAILDTVSRVHEMVYSMMRRLRPSVLDEVGIGPAIKTLVAEWRQHHPWVPCELDLTDDLDGLDDLLYITIYRAVQEALTNVACHSAATRVKVSVARESTAQGEQVSISIEDNGRGMNIEEARTTADHFGLRGMAERVDALSGKLEFVSAPGQGTRMIVKLPVEPAVAGDA